MEFTDVFEFSKEYLEKLDAEATNIKIEAVSVINNEISIKLKNKIMLNGHVSLLFFDREEKIIVSEQEVISLNSKEIKVVLNEESLENLQKNIALNKIRVCLLECISNEYKLYYIKNPNSVYFSNSISMVKKLVNNYEVLLYYSAAGLLSIKVIRSNKVLFDSSDVLVASKNIVVKKVNADKLSILFDEDIPKCVAMELLVISGNFKTEVIKTTNVVGNIGDVEIKQANQLDIKWNISPTCSNFFSENKRYCLILRCIYEEYTELVLLTKNDFVSRDRFVYDVRSNYYEPFKVNDSYDIVPYFGNKGIMILVSKPQYVYKEQVTAILSDINLDNGMISISAKCRQINGEYKGFMLCDGYDDNEHFISNVVFDKSGKFINVSATLYETDFYAMSGNVEIYIVFEIKGKKYYIPIIAGDNTLVRNVKSKKPYLESRGAVIYSLLSSKNKLYFTKKYVTNAFDSKNQQKKIKELSFNEVVDAISEIKPIGNIYGEIESLNENVLTLGVSAEVHDVSDVALVCLNEIDKVSLVQEISIDMWKNRKLEVGMNLFEGYNPVKESDVFRLCVLIKYKEAYFYLRFCNPYKKDKVNQKSIYDRRNSYYLSTSSKVIEEYNIIPYYAMNGTISINVPKEELAYIGQFTNQLDEVRIHRNNLVLKATCLKLEGAKWIGFKLKYRGKRKEDNESIIVPCAEILEGESNVVIKALADLRNVHLKMIFWDIFCVFEIEGKQYDVRAFCKDEELSKHYEKVFCKDHFVYKDSSIIYPYITKTNTVALAHREYYKKHDTISFRMKERLALNIYNKHKKKFDSKNIYLIYEKYCTAAQDNGYYFFKYCMENNVEKQINGKIYYVIDKKSNEYNNVAKYDDHVLDFTSLKHMIYLLAARLYISTDTKEHSYVYRAKGSILLPYILNKEYIFLQHGVIALKKIDHVYSKGKFGQCKKFVVSSNYERDIVAREFKYDKKDLIVTGLARWDVLEDKSEGKRKIMIVPTWRSWLDDVENDTFVNSNYFKSYMELLNDERLYKLLEEYDVTADFYIHIKFKDYIHNFDSKDTSRVRLIVFGEQPLNELMMECKLLITDYSSVSWDIYYQKKPVLFYQFDVDDYMYAHGSYINFETELFGERAQNLDKLFELLEDYMKSDFELKPKYAAIQEGYFKYIDNNNSERIWNEIKKIHSVEFKNK